MIEEVTEQIHAHSDRIEGCKAFMALAPTDRAKLLASNHCLFVFSFPNILAIDSMLNKRLPQHWPARKAQKDGSAAARLLDEPRLPFAHGTDAKIYQEERAAPMLGGSRNITPFLLQDDDVIINKTVLLRGAQDDRRQSIIDTFPYFLGTVDESLIAKEQTFAG